MVMFTNIGKSTISAVAVPYLRAPNRSHRWTRREHCIVSAAKDAPGPVLRRCRRCLSAGGLSAHSNGR